MRNSVLVERLGLVWFTGVRE